MKYFITGGAGFVGSHLSLKLLTSDPSASVIIYDNFSSGNKTLLNACLEFDAHRINIIEGDLKHLGLLTHAMTDADFVFHLAANPDIAKAARFPDVDFWEGTYLTHNVLEAMRINHVKRIIYMSGSGVYGEVNHMAFSESYGPCFPISPYGASKLASEALISSYCHMFNIIGRAFRCANIIGPRQTHGVGYDFLKRLSINPKELHILGDGTQCKSYIHVNDVLSAIWVVLKNNCHPSHSAFDVFNIATDDSLTVTEIADLCCQTLNLNTDTVTYHYSGGDRGWNGDVPKVLFNVTKIKSLGWHTTMDSKQAMLSSLQSILHNMQPNNGGN